MQSTIVAGWFTPDYSHYLPPLRASLDRFGHEHDFVAVSPASGGRERNTMRKPAQILAAMDRHPNRAIVFLDVDCEVLAPLDALAEIKSDVAVHFMVDRRSRGYGRMFGSIDDDSISAE